MMGALVILSLLSGTKIRVFFTISLFSLHNLLLVDRDEIVIFGGGCRERDHRWNELMVLETTNGK